MKHTYLSLLIFSFLAFNGNVVEAQDNQVTNNNISIQDIEYYAGTTRIKLNNNTYNYTKLILTMEIYSSETESSFQTQEEFVLDEKQKILMIEDQYFCKAFIEIHHHDGQLIAKEEISDGEWKIHNPEDLFFQRFYKEERNPGFNTMLVERSLVVVPRLYNKVHLTKTLQATSEKFHAFSFHAEGLDEVEIIFETEDDQYKIFLEDLEDGQQILKLSEANNDFGEAYNGTNLIKIHFELKSFQLAMPIKLKDLEFNKISLTAMKQKKNENKHQVYPNPTNGILNIDMEQSGTYKLEIHNAYQPVYLKMVEINGSAQIQLPQLTPGAYVYKISNEKDEWVRKLIVR